MAVGARTLQADARSALAQAGVQAGRMEELVLEAHRIAGNILAGWHGRRKQGPGENFWQFRPYVAGEAATYIDWRRSARDNYTYIRDREQDTAQTVFIWPDMRASMRYQSRAGLHSKEMCALMLVLVLAELFSCSGERIAVPGILELTNARNEAERAALALGNAGKPTKAADFSCISRHAEVIIASDFLSPMEEIIKIFSALVERNVRAHLVEIADPAEVLFPFSGHIMFHDPEDGRELTAGRAESYRDDYRRLYEARHHSLAAMCRR